MFIATLQFTTVAPNTPYLPSLCGLLRIPSFRRNWSDYFSPQFPLHFMPFLLLPLILPAQYIASKGFFLLTEFHYWTRFWALLGTHLTDRQADFLTMLVGKASDWIQFIFFFFWKPEWRNGWLDEFMVTGRPKYQKFSSKMLPYDFNYTFFNSCTTTCLSLRSTWKTSHFYVFYHLMNPFHSLIPAFMDTIYSDL